MRTQCGHGVPLYMHHMRQLENTKKHKGHKQKKKVHAQVALSCVFPVRTHTHTFSFTRAHEHKHNDFPLFSFIFSLAILPLC
eukprot:m.451506 g.451506  ORF g.451506 m.451506 type:complete len:82 (+) comp20324_c2_seq28:590-835(+)